METKLEGHLKRSRPGSAWRREARGMESKADYVRKQAQFRNHHCHWPGCPKQVPPAMWGCKEHWFRLPSALRAAIWREYRPGQEKDMRPSQEYLNVAKQVEDWILTNGGA